jgi:hypothetical protein
VVIKRALLVTDPIPDKGDFPSQVYRGIPAGPAVPAVDQRLNTIDGTGDQISSTGCHLPFCIFCVDDLGAYLNESSTQKKGYSKDGKLRAFPAHCYTY